MMPKTLTICRINLGILFGVPSWTYAATLVTLGEPDHASHAVASVLGLLQAMATSALELYTNTGIRQNLLCWPVA